MALAYGNPDDEKQGYYQMEEEAPPPAFQMDVNPSTPHIPTNSIMSIEAEVFKEPQRKPLSPAANMNQFNNMMNMNNMMMPNMNNMNNMNNRNNMQNVPPNNMNMKNVPPNNMMNMAQFNNMMPPNMQNVPPNMKNMPPNMKNMPPNMKNMPNNAMGNNAAMPFPILSEDFMNNMMNMAINMDVKDMNKNMANNLQNMQFQQRQSKNNINNVKMDNIRKAISSPNVIKNNNEYNIPKSNPNKSYPKPPPKKKEPEVVHIPSQVIAQQPIPSQIIEKQKSEFDNPIQEELVSMGFEKDYVIRACNLYKKKFTNKPLRLEVLTEIIIRLQQRDQNRNRAKSIDSVAAPVENKQNINQNNNGNHQRRRSSFQGASAQKMQNVYNNAQLPQSMSYDYNLPNGYGKGNDNINNNGNSNGESVAITIIMPSSSIGLQTCDIIIRKDQTLQDAKQLISTCLADFDQFDESYAFFHDDSGFIFTEFDVTVIQALQLMDINVDDQNIVITLKIGRVVSKYIKLK